MSAIDDYNRSHWTGSKADAELHNFRGVAYYSLEQFCSAITDFDEAIKLDAKDQWKKIARLPKAGKADLKGALDDYNKAIEIDGEDRKH